MKNPIETVIFIGDEHAGCRLGLCPIRGVTLDSGSRYKPNKVQRKIWRHWNYIDKVWIPMVTKGQKYTLVNMGDAIDNKHHGSVTQFSHNRADHIKVAYELLAPWVEKADRFYMLRGTEAHSGKSGEFEELLAEKLGAIPDEHGRYARDDLWMKIGPALGHFTHHVATVSSPYTESTGILKELITAYTAAGKMGIRAPNLLGRAHRHACSEIRLPGKYGYDIAFATSGWQAKGPFVWRMVRGRNCPVDVGASMAKWDEREKEIYTRHKVWYLERPRTER